MAEAAVGNMSKYFCHHCSQETNTVLPDYTCPRCMMGFIEEVTHDDEDPVIFDDDSDASNNSMSHDERPINEFLSNLCGSLNGANHSEASNGASTVTTQNQTQGTATNNGVDSNNSRIRGRTLSDGSSQNQSSRRPRTHYVQFNVNPTGHGHDGNLDAQQTIEGLFHLLTSAVGPHQIPGRDGGARAGPGFINIDFPLPLFQVLHGNPGDYAWGAGGLDAVITQLLNQLDGTGPPPMQKEEIEGIPTVAITQDQVDKNLQCTVCMEDFKVGEKVKRLVCMHCYHNDCLVPWLQLHGTCPICRKELNESRSNHGVNFRGPSNQRFNNSQHPSNSSGGGGSNSTNNSHYEFFEDYD